MAKPNEQKQEEPYELDPLVDKLVERLRAFMVRAAEDVTGETDIATLEIAIMNPQWEDDDMPYLEAHIKETFTAEEVSGHVPKTLTYKGP